MTTDSTSEGKSRHSRKQAKSNPGPEPGINGPSTPVDTETILPPAHDESVKPPTSKLLSAAKRARDYKKEGPAPAKPVNNGPTAPSAPRPTPPTPLAGAAPPHQDSSTAPAEAPSRDGTKDAIFEPPSGQVPDPSPLSQPVDGLALWDSEAAGVAPAGLETVRLDQNEHLLIPFTRSMLRVILHYVGFAAIAGYVRCNGPDCLLCRLGRQPEKRDLWPVYDVLARAVAVLPISPSMRPHALRSQLFPALRRMAEGEGPLLLAVRKDGNSKFIVSALPLPEGADDGAAVIGPFCERLKAGQVDLASAFPAIPNVELAMIDEVSLMMQAKGLVL